jgi:hypothetical protein
MPHDLNNREIREGDIVMVPCVVKSVYQTDGDQYCNVNLVTQNPMPPYTEGSAITLNTRQVVLHVSKSPEDQPA